VLAACTKAVVANCVVFVPAVAVGAVGVPVSVAEPLYEVAEIVPSSAILNFSA